MQGSNHSGEVETMIQVAVDEDELSVLDAETSLEDALCELQDLRVTGDRQQLLDAKVEAMKAVVQIDAALNSDGDCPFVTE